MKDLNRTRKLVLCQKRLEEIIKDINLQLLHFHVDNLFLGSVLLFLVALEFAQKGSILLVPGHCRALLRRLEFLILVLKFCELGDTDASRGAGQTDLHLVVVPLQFTT